MPRFKFRRGEPVVHFSLVGPHISYWGRKTGAFRVLASNPATLDSGPCISEKEVGHSIFPAPNEHGVFDDRHATAFVYRGSSGRDTAEARVLQIAPDQWAYAVGYAFNTGGYAGAASPLTAQQTAPTEYEAVSNAIANLFRMLIGHVRQVASDAPRMEKRRKAVRNAMIALLHQISPEQRDTIFMLLNDSLR